MKLKLEVLKPYGKWFVMGGVGLALAGAFGLLTANWVGATVIGAGVLSALSVIERSERIGMMIATGTVIIVGGANAIASTPFIGGLFGQVISALLPMASATAVTTAFAEIAEKYIK